MLSIFYILNIYFLQKFSYINCNLIDSPINEENLNLPLFEHLITGESVLELNNDILHLKSSSLRNFNIKMYESKPEEEIQYTEEIPRYIIQPPPILYTSKWQPAVVQCVAESVVLLYIVCVTNPSNSNARYDYSTETTGLPTVYHTNQKFRQHRNSDNDDDGDDDDVKFVENSSVNYNSNNNHNGNNKHNRKVVVRLIDENTVEEWFGDYWCQCEAWNNILELGEPRVKISNQTHVRIACKSIDLNYR
ncbi:unnamed protein product [Trichobilharzia regenti]|nr:unnamed protein product [Trichobilharzia regenti]